MLKLTGPARRKRLPPARAEDAERRRRVAEAAYHLAEQRGFEPGRELDDWFMAENIVDGGTDRGPKG